MEHVAYFADRQESRPRANADRVARLDRYGLRSMQTQIACNVDHMHQASFEYLACRYFHRCNLSISVSLLVRLGPIGDSIFQFSGISRENFSFVTFVAGPTP